MAKSLITFYVEHGDTTDPLNELIHTAYFDYDMTVLNYEVAVDITDEQAEVVLLATNPTGVIN